MLRNMEILNGLNSIASSIKKSTEKLESRAEKMSFLHQTLLSISNILDIEESGLRHSFTTQVSGDRIRPSVNQNSTNGSLILQLHNQRLMLQKNSTCDLQCVSSYLLSSQHSAEDTSTSESVSSALEKVLSSLEHLCCSEWTWITDKSTNRGSAIDKKGDPFSKECYNVGEESRTFVIQYLRGIQERCQKLTEQEKLLSCKVNASKQSSAGIDEGSIKIQFDSDLDECIWRIRERLRGYDDCLRRLLTDLKDWSNEQWINTLEENHQLLEEPRWVKRLLELGMEFSEEIPQKRSNIEIINHTRLLKVSSQCFAALPLPLQCVLFQWLWEQPKGPSLFKTGRVINVQKELTLVFNRLVSADSQIIEIAREVCCVALCDPSTTIQRALEVAVTNTGAGQILCQILQCIPFLASLDVDGSCCFTTELHRFIESLGRRDLSSAEELNLLKFLDQLMKPYSSPCHPDLPGSTPPLISPNQLASSCIFPFLLHHPTQHPTPNTKEHPVPLTLILKLLSLVLESSTVHPRDSPVFGVSACFTTMLCLCYMWVDTGSDAGGTGDGANWVQIKETATELLLKMVDYVKQYHEGALATGVEWLLEQTASLDWSVGLMVNTLFLEVNPACEKNIHKCVREITESFATGYDEDMQMNEKETVPMYVTWSCSLIAFFQGCRISSQVAELFIKHLPSNILAKSPSSSRDFYQAMCVALSQVLQHSTTAEWLTILRSLDQLLVRGLLHVSYTSQFMTSLPMVDLSLYRHPLELSQVFTAIVQLLGNACVSASLTQLSWQHISKNYACVMKELLEKAMSVHSTFPSSSPALLFLIGQFFCQSCEVARCVPASGSDHLFVWCLELLMRVEELAKNEILDSLFHQERKTFSLAVDSLANPEHKATLRQKLNAIFPS